MTNNFETLEGSGVNNNNQINLSKGGIQYTASNADRLLVSLNGVIQNHADYELINGGATLRFPNTTVQGDTTFVLDHPSLQPLSITGSAGTTFDIGVTPSSNCQLLIFFVGVNQTHLTTDYTISGSTITFPTSVDPSEIFGWYINETVECEKPTITGLNQHLSSKNSSL